MDKKTKEISIDDLAVMVNNGFTNLEKNFNTRMDHLESRIDGVETEVVSLGTKIDEVEENLTNRIQGLERRIDHLVDTHKDDVRALDKRVVKIEKNLGFA